MIRFRFRHGNVAFAHDVAMATASFALSLYLRVGNAFPQYETVLIEGTLLMALVAGIVFRSLGLYRGIWRYASMNDLLALVRAVTIVILAFVPALFVLTRAESLPRSVPVINWVMLLVLVGGPRFAYRVLKDRHAGLSNVADAGPAIPVLLVGAGDGADLFIRAVARGGAGPYRPVGMIGIGDGRVGRNIHGVDVLGIVEDIPAVVDRLDRAGTRPQRLVITRDDLDGAVVRRLLDTAEALGLTVARLPKLSEFRQGLGDRIEVRPVAIEDLLGRPQAVLDRDSMRRLIASRRVLVTGAGGTIGSELVRQIAAFGPSELILLDSGEFALYGIDLEMRERFADLPRRSLVADVRDRERLHRVIAEAAPDLVFHAAALKHVPIVEENPFEGMLTNAIGTRNVADACRAAGVAAMVQISTDKAVNPTSIMGVSKRIAEGYCQALDIAERERAGSGTRFVTVRFGNVLGSTGSVVPLFQRQLAAGGPLTVTHPDVQRYFMTVREAVELVLQASVLGTRGDEPGKIFVLDMGEPVRIVDLARQMILLAGLRPNVDVEIRFTGLRPGEKLFEEIFHGAEPLLPTEAKGVLLAAPRTADAAALGRALDELAQICRREDRAAFDAMLRRLVPEYQPPSAARIRLVSAS
ncbi:MAG TPA: nucleoside-diphosphate sugar epimerase/dehydratase [Stellaceae bacterium]|jgi:O-antigen biosynthesis protein WbqV